MNCCHDSVLSWVGNIISVLTFAFAVGAWYFTFYTLTCSAIAEIEDFKADLDRTRVQLLPILECCGLEACLAPLKLNDLDGALQRSIVALTHTLESLYKELEEIQKEHEGCGPWPKEQLSRRLKWVWKRKEISERMVRISNEKTDVHISQMGLLLRKITAQEHLITAQLEQTLPHTKNE